MRPKHLLLLLVLLTLSCKLKRRDLIGTFACRPAPTIRLVAYEDSTFEFIKITKNPYLHPFAHPDENFFVTTGYWTLTSTHELILNSRSNFRYRYKPPQVFEKPAEHPGTSHFLFYDFYRQPVKILYVEFSDKSIEMALHRSMPSFSYDYSK